MKHSGDAIVWKYELITGGMEMWVEGGLILSKYGELTRQLQDYQHISPTMLVLTLQFLPAGHYSISPVLQENAFSTLYGAIYLHKKYRAIFHKSALFNIVF